MKLILIVVVAVSLVFVGLYFFSRKLLYFPAPVGNVRMAQLSELIERSRDQGPYPIKELSLAVDKNINLQAWIIEKDIQTLPTIFYFGGNAEEVSLNMEEYLAHVDANIVLVNYRGFGASTGSPGEDDLKADALAVFDQLSAVHGLKPERCAVWGRSIGSSIASYLALERGLGKLILTCPFDSIEAVAAGFYPAWLVGLVLKDTHRTIDFSARITSDTLILAALEDEIIAPERTQALYDSLTCSREMVKIPGAGHNTISEFAGYYDAVNRFLREE